MSHSTADHDKLINAVRTASQRFDDARALYELEPTDANAAVASGYWLALRDAELALGRTLGH